MDAARVQALYSKFMGKGAAIVGDSYAVRRPLPNTDATQAALVATVLASFSQGYNYNRVAKYDDVLWNGILDPDKVRVGDILTGLGYVYFVAALDPLLPSAVVRCTSTVTLLRSNSEATTPGAAAGALPSGGGGHYFGQSRSPQTDAGAPGEQTLCSNVPALLLANAGRATGAGQLPDDAPGPARWRIYTPASLLPENSIQNRDKFVDSNGNRYDVSAAQWTRMGYRSECVRLEM